MEKPRIPKNENEGIEKSRNEKSRNREIKESRNREIEKSRNQELGKARQAASKISIKRARAKPRNAENVQHRIREIVNSRMP